MTGRDPAFAASPSSQSSLSRPSGLQSGVGFTPGPWRYRPHQYDDWGFVRAPSKGADDIGGIICQARDPDVWEEADLNEHRRNKTDPWEANARLIAAAPELYEALENALPMLRMLAKFGEDNVWRPAKRNLDAFEAVLAKARGEAA